MIPTFEKYTTLPKKDLLKKVVPLLVKYLKTCKGKEKVCTNKDMSFYYLQRKHKIRIRSAIFRQLIHYIRVNGLVKCLIANSDGYYIGTSHEELDTYVHSLYARASSIREVAAAIRMQQQVAGTKLKQFYVPASTKKPKKKKFGKRRKMAASAKKRVIRKKVTNRNKTSKTKKNGRNTRSTKKR